MSSCTTIVMKDSEGTEINKCDLVLVTIDTPTREVTELVIFLEMEERVYNVTEDGEERSVTTRTMKYYPLTPEGLEVAKYDAREDQLLMHRQTKYTYTNITSDNLLIVDGNKLSGYKRQLYDSLANYCEIVDNLEELPECDPPVYVSGISYNINARPFGVFLASNGTWNNSLYDNAVYSYQWYDSNGIIEGATSPSYEAAAQPPSLSLEITLTTPCGTGTHLEEI